MSLNFAPDLFRTPTSKTKVRNGIFAYRYSNGIIVIGSQKYQFYTIKEAIAKYRRDNPMR